MKVSLVGHPDLVFVHCLELEVEAHFSPLEEEDHFLQPLKEEEEVVEDDHFPPQEEKVEEICD